MFKYIKYLQSYLQLDIHDIERIFTYEGKDFIREIIPKKESINPIITIKELNYPVKISTISHLQNLPEAFHYYRGDRDNPEGISIRLLNNNIARIPFPDIIDAKKDFELELYYFHNSER